MTYKTRNEIFIAKLQDYGDEGEVFSSWVQKECIVLNFITSIIPKKKLTTLGILRRSPIQILPTLTLLNFSDRTRTGVFDVFSKINNSSVYFYLFNWLIAQSFVCSLNFFFLISNLIMHNYVVLNKNKKCCTNRYISSTRLIKKQTSLRYSINKRTKRKKRILLLQIINERHKRKKKGNDNKGLFTRFFLGTTNGRLMGV